MNELLRAYRSAITRLQAAKGQRNAIAEKMGKTPAWVSMIANEKIADPGIHAIARLIDALDELEKPRSASIEQGAGLREMNVSNQGDHVSL